ncbi:MAG: hypothetical protein S4CHLAM37_03220 [Chlamydiia bacterium]|nr:hypothetical protein [Chlamydiia bacterium]
MSRRDTIIVAVLINAGLLVVLFVSSLKHEPSKALAKNHEKSLPRHAEKIVKKEVPIAKVKKESSRVQQSRQTKLAKAPQVPVVEKKIPELVQEKKLVQVVKEPAPVAKAVVKEEFKKVIVKKGDFLEKIAKSNHTTVGALMEKNNLRDSKLQIGQVLLIPKSTAPNAQQVVSSEERYVVQEGDNLWKIAIENDVSVEALLRLNKLTQKKAKMLRPGDKLILR